MVVRRERGGMGSEIDMRPGHCWDRRGPSAKTTRDAVRSKIVRSRRHIRGVEMPLDDGLRGVPQGLLR